MDRRRKRTATEAGLMHIEAEQPVKRLYTTGGLIEYLESQLADKLPQRRQRRRRREEKHSFGQRWTPIDLQKLVVYLRYHSLTNDSRPVRSIDRVVLKTGVKPSTVSTIISRWRKRGFHWDLRPYRPATKEILTSEMKIWICSAKTL